MSDLLWLANHPLRGNVVGIPTSRNPDTLEGLESQLSIGIHRILAELLHSTEPELKKLCWTWMDSQSFRARATLRTPDKPGSPPALKTLSLSLYSTRMILGAL
jgi:hypothetical protein